MAEEQKVAVFTPGVPGSRTSDDGMVSTAQDVKLRKELNAYAVMAYVAVSDRNAMAEQLKGLSHLTQAVNELQEKLTLTEKKAESLQLEVWRNEAFVTRSRIQLRVKDSEIAGLRKEMNNEESSSERKSTESDGRMEGSKTAESELVIEDEGEKKEEGANAVDHMEKKTKSPQPGKSDYLMSRGLQIGISREIHEAVVQENLHLKGHLTQVLEDQGASFKDLMDIIQYKEMIKQLKRKIDEKEDEIAKIRATLKQADSPQEQIAKTLFEMEEKVKNSERTIKMKHVMIEALSSRCEELSKALENVQQRDEIQMAHMRSVFSDGSHSATTADSSVDQVLPSVLIKNLTKENARLKKLHKHQEVENDLLRKERDTAKVEKTEIERHLASLSQMTFQPCTTCKDLKAAKEHAEEELGVTKGELSAALFQVETYKSDFKERCAEMEKVKSGLRNELDTWKRNFEKLNKQMEHLKFELGEQMRNNSKLQADNQFFAQAYRQRRGELGHLVPVHPVTFCQCRNPYEVSASMPTMAAERCGERNSWQESMDYTRRPSEIAVVGGRRDQSDLPRDEANSPESHQWTMARPTGSSRRRQGKLTCIQCRREFSPERQHEYEDHQRRCTDNS